MNGRVLVVAGSDSGGGAGIQADIKVITALGGYAATAITALTAQNTLGVHGVFPVDPSFVAQQMDVVLADIGADCIKTGMLCSAETIASVVRVYEQRARHVPLVVDPVMVAKGGAPLLAADATKLLAHQLIPLAALVTPNLPEAEVLTGRPVKTVDDMGRAADELLELGAAAVLVKGGHLEGDRVVDLLRTADGEEHLYEDERIASQSTHGTGCALASAIAAGIAEGLRLSDAVARARRYVREAIRHAPGLGRGNGPLQHAWRLAFETQAP
ncbi:MAG: bifunctional hydroxymethylpyrimidine kinase/phosphomethylpyrimidine kinase [Polyangiaceae bacterium]|nr:bifunctional hydroxymethylpyrimidine kinase/phosphomethylpyrimidine kinase [Polyangiaceae bacterium]